MTKVNKLLAQRMKSTGKSAKMETMAKKSAGGNLTSFSGLFGGTELNEREKETIRDILEEYDSGKENISEDLTTLILLTSEVKAITNQAVLLHGERIKKAQAVLKKYKEGAFTAWLIATYGNRQTPYNFLQYYEFSTAIPSDLRSLMEQIPRQAIYTLASRQAPLSKKQAFIESYQGETKHELLAKIRELFPLDDDDKRKENVGESTITYLRRLSGKLARRKTRLTKRQKAEITELLEEINLYITGR